VEERLLHFGGPHAESCSHTTANNIHAI
jgi:hypothetical protein